MRRRLVDGISHAILPLRKYWRTVFADDELIDGNYSCCLASSPQVVNPVLPGKETPAAFCKLRRESKKHGKRRDLEHNTSDTVVQNLPRSNLFDCLKAHWETLKVEGIFAIPSRQVFMWTLEGNSEQVRRLHHLIVCHLDVEDDLHQWRRSIVEMRNLDGSWTSRARRGSRKWMLLF